jgi:flagellar biosynthesis/type III secretory pathway chaperone
MTNEKKVKQNAPWDGLIQILNRQSDKYNEFLGFLKQKEKSVIKGDSEKLKELTAREKGFITALEALEDVRIETVNECVEDKGVTLREMLGLAPEAFHAELEAAAVRLMEILNQVALVNKTNAELIELAIQFTGYTVNLLTSSDDVQETTYESTGRIREQPLLPRGLLNKQV